jgi:hypothetical protein
VFPKKLAGIFAAVGFGIPILILVIDWATTGWYPNWGVYVWPTWIILYPYGGTFFSFEKLLYILLSAGLNAGIYAVVGYLVGRLVQVIRQEA